MATQADMLRKKIEEYLAEYPDGASFSSIMEITGKASSMVSYVLGQLAKENRVVSLEKGIWRLSGTVVPELKPPQEELGKVMEAGTGKETTEEIKIPDAYDKFLQLCRTVGIKEDFAKSVTDHLFLGDVYDLNFVWDTLQGMFLRPDVTKRIFNFWSRIVNLPIPAGITAQIMPRATEAAKEAEAKLPTRFTLIGDEIVADPEGEFTFSQARQMLMTKAIQGAAPQLGGEKVSEIIGAISPFLQQQQTARAAEIEKQGETSVLATVVKSLIEQKGGNAQQPMTLSDIMSIVDKIDEARRATAAAIVSGNSRQPTALDELERMANVFNTLKGVFGSSKEGTSPITIAVKGEDGTTGAIPLETFFAIDDHKRKVRQEEEELDNKRETGKTMRGFLDKIAKAAANVAMR